MGGAIPGVTSDNPADSTSQPSVSDLLRNPSIHQQMAGITVMIATAGRAGLLQRTLASLGQCAISIDLHETVVVENGPRCGAEEITRSAPPALKVRYMHVERGNKSAALNAAIETIGDGLIFFADDDVRFAPEVLTAYAQAASACGPGHFFGGPVAADYEAAPPAWLRSYLPKSATGWEASAQDFPTNSNEFLGFNWAAYVSDLREAGGFNPDRGPGAQSQSTGQESEMQRRLVRRGTSSIYVPAARVWHYVPAERCSQRWAVQRAFRHGVEEGTRAAEERELLPGLPSWRVVRHCLAGVVRSSGWILSPQAHVRFRAKWRLSYDRGLLHGTVYQKRILRSAASANASAPVAETRVSAECRVPSAE
jgi:GT2 family glycosyltransferase